MQSVNPKIVGAFVLGAVLLALVGVILFGKGSLFQKRIPVVMNFQGSVGGLQVGSPISFRGVQIGVITEIDLQYNLQDGLFTIPVFGDLRPENLSLIGVPNAQPAIGFGQSDALLRQLIERGFRAQLSLPNFITRQVTVEVDMFPLAPAAAVRTIDGRIEIPTVASPIQEVTATLETLFKKLQQLPLDEMIDEGRALLSGANRLMNDPRLPQIILNVDETVAGARAAIVAIDARITPLVANLDRMSGAGRDALVEANKRLAEMKGSLDQLDRTLQAAQATVRRADQLMQTTGTLIEPGSPLVYELTSTLREVASTMRSIRAFASTLERQPNAVIFGRQLPVEGR